uniref:Uncharacterized protein n=1 Tax=viral metagenome TaxID=1070528 RepID=A0A6C0DAN7_9ZZZZ
MSNLEKIDNLISKFKNKSLKIAIHNSEDYVDILRYISNILKSEIKDKKVDENDLETDLNKIAELINSLEKESTKIINKRKFLCNIFSSCYATVEVKHNDLTELLKSVDKLKNRISDVEEISSVIPNIRMNFQAELPLTVNYIDSNTRPTDYKDDAYGYGFNNKMFLEFEVPNLNVKNTIFKSIEIIGTFHDQEFGGTSQSHIRVYVNKEIKEFIYYNREIGFNYKIILTDLKKGDIVSAWACSPEWQGWSLTINEANVNIYFVELI